MKKLLNQINKLRNSDIKELVNSRLNSFEKLNTQNNNELFKELCFCLLTANFNAERGIEIQKIINNKFLTLSEKQLAKQLKNLGYRFPNTRADYIIEARKYKNELREKIRDLSETEMREWLVENIRGFGYKEASHFLRNIGYKDVAIVDFHIADLLVKYNLISKPHCISKKCYMEIEGLLRNIGSKTDLDLASLDLYLWYMETGKVLK